MALIAECDHPGCQERTRASWLPSGRLVVEGWFVLPATHLRPLALACCQAHVPGVPDPGAAERVRARTDMVMRGIKDWQTRYDEIES